MKIAITCAALVVAGGLFTADYLTRPAPVLVAGPAYVIDGDTIDVDGHRVRLWGIQAPEMDTVMGLVSRDILRQIVKGSEIACKVRGRDRYRRLVAICFRGDKDIARLMVELGSAEDWPAYSGGYYEAR